MVIQSPPGWGWDQLQHAAHEIGSATPEEYWHKGAADTVAPTVRRIAPADLKDALAQGLADFQANRTDVIFLCVIYPVIGLILGRVASGHALRRKHRSSTTHHRFDPTRRSLCPRCRQAASPRRL